LVLVLLQPGAAALGLRPLQIEAEHRAWVVGTGAPTMGEPDIAIANAVRTGETAPTAATATEWLRLPLFELFRALTGRRSEAQVRALTWSCDPTEFLPLFSLGLFRLRESDLVE
jgi:hypothetical protein